MNVLGHVTPEQMGNLSRRLWEIFGPRRAAVQVIANEPAPGYPYVAVTVEFLEPTGRDLVWGADAIMRAFIDVLNFDPALHGTVKFDVTATSILVASYVDPFWSEFTEEMSRRVH